MRDGGKDAEAWPQCGSDGVWWRPVDETRSPIDEVPFFLSTRITSLSSSGRRNSPAIQAHSHPATQPHSTTARASSRQAQTSIPLAWCEEWQNTTWACGRPGLVTCCAKRLVASSTRKPQFPSTWRDITVRTCKSTFECVNDAFLPNYRLNTPSSPCHHRDVGPGGN